MKTVLVYGATGMIGQGVLRECLLDPEVEQVIAVTRRPTGVSDPKLVEIVRADVTDLTGLPDAIDACFFCLGISSIGMSEDDYRAVTNDLTLAIATPLAARHPAMTFVYVSGAGADGRAMWARVRSKTEQSVLALPFHGYVVRPAFIQPMHGEASRTGWVRVALDVTRPLQSLMVRYVPSYATTTEQMGRAMLGLARHGFPRRVLESIHINAVRA
ncbi:NAD(P)H-binding protein [Nonomuraea sp. NPDC050663]|uniref:NAD(P)H-binding protein n=1 Tax=Nonomuraea sp. NPDC050663 TaxID=3364370 RepID=UPI00378AA33E